MSVTFDPNARSVLVPVTLFGSRLDYTFRFALDTAATRTSIRPELLRRVGYDLTRPVKHNRIRSATGTAVAPLFRVSRIEALEQARMDFLVAAHDLPLGAEPDGLLGLDFFRGFVLKLDFIRGRVTLTGPRWWQFWQ